MEVKINRIWVVLVAVLLTLPAATIWSQDMQDDQELTLTGQLTFDDGEGYLLIERESGDAIALGGSVSFAEHVGSEVDVTGKWAESSEGQIYFEVTRIGPATS